MYIVFSQICMVNKIRSFFFFFFKKLTQHNFFFNIYLGKNNSLTRVKIHESNCEDGTIRHVSNWTRV